MHISLSTNLFRTHQDCQAVLFNSQIHPGTVHVATIVTGSKLGDSCIQIFHLWRYIVGYTVGNLVLRRRVSGAIKRDFRTYIRRYTSPNENFEYDYPHSNALLTFSLQKDSENVLCCAYTSSGSQLHETACQLHKFTCQPMKATLRNDVGFSTV